MATVPFSCKQTLSNLGLAALIPILESSGGGGSGNWTFLEDHSSACDGSNTSFTLADTPAPPESCVGYVRQGGAGAFLPMVYGIDFTISGAVVTTTTPPDVSSNLYFTYEAA